MSEYYGNNDWRDYLAHSWGKKPEQKKREKEYNAWYWDTHKEEIMRKRGQKGKRPLAREKNVTGKGKVERRGEGLNEPKLSDENKKVYDKTLTEFIEGYKNGYRLEDHQDLQVALWENGWKGSFEDLEKEAPALYEKIMGDFNKTNKAEKKAPTGNKLDKTDKPNRPNRSLAREKNIMGKGKGVHRRTDMIRDREKTKYLWDERRHDFVKNK